MVGFKRMSFGTSLFMNAPEVKQIFWNTNTMMLNDTHGSVPSATMDNFVLPDGIWV